jgi:hypothetical protein
MADDWTINWVAKSGKTYKYWIYKIGHPMLAKGGNYIFAKETSSNYFVPIYIGQTDNLDLRFDNHHKKDCIIAATATHIHTHLNAVERDRLDEESDLIAHWKPSCNG